MHKPFIVRANMDQSWAAARDWYADQDPHAMELVQTDMSENCPKSVLKRVSKSHAAAEIIVNLAMLALGELATRSLEKDE